MSYQREVQKALERAGFTYMGSGLEVEGFDSFQIWESPDGSEQFRLCMDEYDESKEE